MKLTIAGIAAFATAQTYAHICQQTCGSFCADEYEQDDTNWNKAGFESVDECKLHSCSNPELNFTAAQWHECEEGSRELEERKYNHIVKMSYQMIKRQGDGTSLSYRELHKKLQNYGCHCFPGQKKATVGKGPAVDPQDNLCRDLARCHRCIDMQYNSRLGKNDVIDPDFAKYRFKIVDNDVSCQRNTDKGKHQSIRDLCECDARFARELAKIWTDASYNRFYWHFPKSMKQIAKGKDIHEYDAPEVAKFDFEATCMETGGGQADACCGVYPERYPYREGDKSCCDNKAIFNSMLSQCCPGGVVSDIGSC